MQATEIMLAGETLLLHPLRAVYWPRLQALLLCDLHIGKAGHFRRGGLPVPRPVNEANEERLRFLLIEWQPARVLFLGDLFHSRHNNEWADFCQLTEQFADIQFELVPGNHDILQQKYYTEARLQLHPEVLDIGPFRLSHHPLLEAPAAGRYNLSGHLHPGVRLRGKGRQRLRLPCFYFGAWQGVLPAFGQFTGLADVQPRAGDQIYVIANDEIIPV